MCPLLVPSSILPVFTIHQSAHLYAVQSSEGEENTLACDENRAKERQAMNLRAEQ